MDFLELMKYKFFLSFISVIYECGFIYKNIHAKAERYTFKRRPLPQNKVFHKRFLQ